MKKTPPKAKLGQISKSGVATQEVFQTLNAKQGGVCAICGGVETTTARNGSIRNLSVDHCHATNRIRGLLCNNCNHGIALFREDVTIMESAIRYLKADYSNAPIPKSHLKLGSAEYSEYLSNRMKGNKHTTGRKWSESQHRKFRESLLRKKGS